MKRRKNREVLRVGVVLLVLGAGRCWAADETRADSDATTPSSAREVRVEAEDAAPWGESPAEPIAMSWAEAVQESVTPPVEPAAEPVQSHSDPQPIAIPSRREPESAAVSGGPLIPSGPRDVPWYQNGMVALAVVLAVIFALLWLLRRYVPSARKASNGPLRVVARTALSPKQSVCLLEVGRRLVLIGVTPDRLTNLGHIQDPDESFRLRANATAPAASAPPPSRFDELLSEEAAEYAELESAPAASPLNPGQLQDTMGQLRSLLGRLRSMQESSPR